MKKTKRSPLECKNFNQVCGLKTDHYGVDDFSIITDGHTVWLSEQKNGEGPTQNIKIPKSVFTRLVKWYEREQAIIKRT